MRLTENQISSIQSVARMVFGTHVKVSLFGSRKDDSLKGGDIDLLIKAGEDKMNIRNKARFLVELKKEIGNQKIDVVFDKKQNSENPFLESVKFYVEPLC